jgi:MoaD family protein
MRAVARARDVKIKVKGYLTVKEGMGGNSLCEFEFQKGTIKDLLVLMCNEFGREFTNLLFDTKTGDLRGDISILLNGRHCVSLPGRLDSELSDGDEVSLLPVVAGG